MTYRTLIEESAKRVDELRAALAKAEAEHRDLVKQRPRSDLFDEARVLALSMADGIWADAVSMIPSHEFGRPRINWFAAYAVVLAAAIVDASIKTMRAELVGHDLGLAPGEGLPSAKALSRTSSHRDFLRITELGYRESVALVGDVPGFQTSAVIVGGNLSGLDLADALSPIVASLPSRWRAKSGPSASAEVILVATGRNMKVWDNYHDGTDWPLLELGQAWKA